MKQKFRLFTLYAAVMGFVMYWLFTIAYSIYASSPNLSLSHKKSSAERIFYQNWSLFTPPDHNYLRLYFISKDSSTNVADTMEVLENLSVQKLGKAPFNQQEDMITQLLYRDLYKLYFAMRDQVDQIKKTTADSSEQYYTADAEQILLQNNNCKTYVDCLRNYAKMIYQNEGISTQHKQLKIMVTTKEMIPFKWPHDKLFVPKEVPLFQTGFTAIQ